jgi:Ca2+-binding RTX toxin-like protein
VGGTGKDWVYGGNERRPFGSDKNLWGGPGNDGVVGGVGSDTLLGGSGNYWVTDGPFRETRKDTLSGGDGDDFFVVNNRPETKDIVSCGDGFDRVLVDSKDVVAPDCERVLTRPRDFGESIPPAVGEFFATFEEEQLAPDPVG